MTETTADAIHMAHCYQGEYEDTCKYGDDDCPAAPKSKTTTEQAALDAYWAAKTPAEERDAVSRMKALGIWKEDEWWHGTVIPTGHYRLKEAPNGRVYLQEWITDTNGWRGKWVKRPRVGAEASDDER
jgi:hypothetical protein